MNVYEAAISRINKVFDEFECIYVSFSGGKDSGVLLNLALEVARERGRKIAVFHMDYEAQYQMSTDYVRETFIELEKEGHHIYHVCLPIKAQCATSMHQDHWIPWDEDKKELWVRDMPTGYGEREGYGIVNESNVWQWFRKGMWDYELQERWGQFMANFAGRPACCLVGIRTQESLNRWRAIHSDKNTRKFKKWPWSRWDGKVCNAYPIYDWLTEDVWTANALKGWKYNRLYDLYHQAGIGIDKMRVASPFNDYATESLKWYRAIDPDNWGKMVGRVNGVNFAGIYGGTTAMGWQSIKLPKGHTWESYMHFLLNTLPPETKANYLSKLETSIRFWKDKGGVLSEDTIKELKRSGVKVDVSDSTNYDTNKKPVRMNYLDDIDIKDFKSIPTFKRMCICIMKNDHLCKYMGFSATKQEAIKRKNIMDKYQKLL